MKQTSVPLQEIISRVVIPNERTIDRSPGFWTGLGTMQQLNQRLENQPFLDFINYNLRGIGQVIFVNNPISGLLILLALFIQSPWVGLMSLIGVVSSTASAIALGLNRDTIRNGIFGYNGILVGAALATFGSSGRGSWNFVWAIAFIVFSVLTTVMQKTFGVWWANTFRSPHLTLPFNIATLLFLSLITFIPQSVFKLGEALIAPSIPNFWSADKLITALPISFGQVFLADKLIAGSLVLLAVAICTPFGALVGLTGAFLGIAVGAILGIVPPDIYAGLWGYNSVLAAMAIGGIFYAPNIRSFAIGSGCALLSTLIIPMLGIVAKPLGLPVLTLPFCLVTIAFFILLSRSLPSLVPVALHSVTSPEAHRHRFLLAKDIIGNFRRQLQLAKSGKGRNFMFDKASEAVRGDLRYVFDAIDSDRSGRLSTAELSSYLTKGNQNMDASELNYLYNCMDRDRNGKIDFEEFGELMLRHRRLMAKYDAFMTYFLPIDTDQNDLISILEMNVALASVNEPPLNREEVNYLQQRTGSHSFTWNQFIELLLLT
ncbi:MAG: urea transporter [Pleurocapsa sp.]